MSVLCCDDCGHYIDTDEEPEAYIEKLDKWLCIDCRNRLPEEFFDD